MTRKSPGNIVEDMQRLEAAIEAVNLYSPEYIDAHGYRSVVNRLANTLDIVAEKLSCTPIVRKQ